MSHSKTAIVTGASSGLGPAIAKKLLANGFNVVLTGRNSERLAVEAERLEPADAVLTISADVGQAADRAELVQQTLDRFGRIDVLVNNAGLFSPKPFLDVSETDLDEFLTTNLKGTYFLSQLVIPHMQAVNGGAILNVGTVLVDHAIAGVPASAAVASKGAIHALTVQLAAEFGKDNIRVNTIAPGIIRTPIHARNGIEDTDSLAGLHLLNRVGEPEQIGSMAVEVVTNEFISGTVFNVDGGHVAGHALA